MTEANTPKLSKKELRKKFGGLLGADGNPQPMPCTRLLGREMDHDFGCFSVALMVIDDNGGTATGMNSYGGNVGKGYDPDAYRNPLPPEGGDKWKAWKKRGYEDWTDRIGQFPQLQNAQVAQPEVPATEEDSESKPKRGRKAAASK